MSGFRLAFLTAILMASIPALAADAARSSFVYSVDGWTFDQNAVGIPQPRAGAPTFEPVVSDRKLVSVLVTDYAGADPIGAEKALMNAIANFRQDLGGATFGVEPDTLRPVAFEGAIEQAVLDMIRKSPELASDIRAKGGLMTAVFEFRPAIQPANANLYLRITYRAKEDGYLVQRILDAPGSLLQDDITGVNVDMSGSGAGS